MATSVCLVFDVDVVRAPELTPARVAASPMVMPRPAAAFGAKVSGDNS